MSLIKWNVKGTSSFLIGTNESGILSNIKIKYRKVTFFMRVRNLCEFVKTGLSINLCDFYLCALALCA